MYATGDGVPQDDDGAARWSRLAAEQGHADAQSNLGVMYRNGRGVPQNDGEALRWYRLAAEQGHAGAQYNLGLTYANGHGVPQDYGEAVRWNRLAADQGYAGAQYMLGLMYGAGRGVSQDYVVAHTWANLAAAQGHEDARELRDTLAEAMSAAQRAAPEEEPGTAVQEMVQASAASTPSEITEAEDSLAPSAQSGADEAYPGQHAAVRASAAQDQGELELSAWETHVAWDKMEAGKYYQPLSPVDLHNPPNWPVSWRLPSSWSKI